MPLMTGSTINPIDWVKAEVVKDSPSKIKSKAKKEEHLNFQLLNRLDKTEQSVDIVSAYFVPEGAERLKTSRCMA